MRLSLWFAGLLKVVDHNCHVIRPQAFSGRIDPVDLGFSAYRLKMCDKEEGGVRKPS